MEFKIVIVGNGGVGKSTWRKSLSGEKFDAKYVPTLGAELFPIVRNTNYGPITFNLWDTAGQEKYGGLRDGYYVGANGAIVMFDVSSSVTRNTVPTYVRDLRRVLTSNQPIMGVANKTDVETRKVKEEDGFLEMSVRGGYNCDLPLLYLARAISDHGDLEFTE